MKQTPLHDRFNSDALKLMSTNLSCVVEVGAGQGTLAREYKKINPSVRYIGVEIDSDYAASAGQYCSEVITGNIEHFSDDVFAKFDQADCWVFIDVLEHLYDPWELLRKIKSNAKNNIEVIACIPNTQHWSIQMRLCSGLLHYEDEGLLDRTHIRFFTRQTMIELFESTGYTIIKGVPIAFQPVPEPYHAAITAAATAMGIDPQKAVNDALPFQWVIKAVPI